MSVKTLEIDGKMVTGRGDETIFSVAWDNGIHIPRLCHVGGLSDVGACRLCLVEIEGQKKLQASCMTKVEEGMQVRTNTPRLKEHRRLILELLFAERNHVCAVCVMNGACELQDLASEMDIDHVRLRYQFPKLNVDISHERFGMDANRCILCTRCVRVCHEVEGAHTWDIAGRGTSSIVISDLGEPWGDSDTCTGCGKCVQVCPTGALFTKGRTVAEMRKDRGFLKYIVTAREKTMDRVIVKQRLATVWMGGCSGCHMSFLDIDERLIALAARVEICYSPFVDTKVFPEVDITLVEGAVANEDHLHDLRMIRENTKILIAFGDCAVTGSVTGMRNYFPVEDVLNRAYRETAATVIGVPYGNGVVPKLLDRVRPLHEYVKVDYFLQGCPPSADMIYEFLTNLLDGKPLGTDGRRFG